MCSPLSSSTHRADTEQRMPSAAAAGLCCSGFPQACDALDRRRQLAAALAAGRARKCPVIVAKLDRLSRDVAFMSGLMAGSASHDCHAAFRPLAKRYPAMVER
jgi:hypothetical protein